MRRIDSTTGLQALYGAAATRRIEARCAAGLPPGTLMQRAGDAVARLALALAPHARRIEVACGPGNNGGDGFEAARLLHVRGKDVTVRFVGDPAHLPADARAAFERAQAAGVRFGPPCAAPADPVPGAATDAAVPDLAIDALLGIGAARAPEGALAAAIRRLNALAAHGCAIVAVDLPSGLDATTGQALGDACVDARHTLALLASKPGLHTGSGRDHAGAVWLDDLGCAPGDETPDAWLSGVDAAARAPRRHAQHKGSFGDVAVVGGAAGMAGAALLAARAAHAAGAGRVYVDLLDAGAAAQALDPLRPELMWRGGWWHDAAPAAIGAATVVCGCGGGGGDAVREALPRLFDTARRLVLDADALNAVAADAALRTALRARAERSWATVLTPHPLEAARMLGGSAADVQADRLGAARRLVDATGCVVVLKGSGSVIAGPGLVPRINATGDASLASAGTGDVLAGWIGGCWAQRPDNVGAVDIAALAALVAGAVAEHGAAAAPPRPGALRAGDLVEALHANARRPPDDAR